MNEEARAARREYMKEYRENNRERINAYQRAWNHAHPEKVAAYNAGYWTRKAAAEQKAVDDHV